MSLDDDKPVQAPLLPDNDPIGHGSLEHAMDFKHRKIAATKRLRDENALKELDGNNIVRGVHQAIDSERPMVGRLSGITEDNQIIRHSEGEANVARPNTAFTDTTSKPGTVLPHDDPRACSMKRQRSMSRAGYEVVRLKSSRLPLEVIPRREEIRSVMLTIGIRDVNVLNQDMLKLGAWDSYDYGRKEKNRLDMTEEIEEVEEKIKKLMESFGSRMQRTQALPL